MGITRELFFVVSLVSLLFSGCMTGVAPQKKDNLLAVPKTDSMAALKNDSPVQSVEVISPGVKKSGEPVNVMVSSQPPGETINVMVSSQPPGAEVFVDGKATGSVTDSLLWNLKGGKHILGFRLSGFKPAFLPVILKGKGIQQLETVKLVKISDDQGSGTLSLIVEPKFADVFMDDKKIEERPISIEVQSGSCEITCSAKGYFSRTMRALVRSGETESLIIKLDRKEDALSLKRLSETYRDMGNLPQAIECIRKAIALEPKVAILHVELINLSLRAGQPKSALIAAQRANILFFDNDSITYLYGLALFETGKAVEAELMTEDEGKAKAKNNRSKST